MSALRYEAVARRKCQFQGRVWRPGQIYRGAAEPPASVFETIATVDVPDAPAANETETTPERTPSDPTPERAAKGKRAARPSEI